GDGAVRISADGGLLGHQIGKALGYRQIVGRAVNIDSHMASLPVESRRPSLDLSIAPDKQALCAQRLYHIVRHGVASRRSAEMICDAPQHAGYNSTIDTRGRIMSRHMSCPPARAMWMALLCCSFTSLERPLLAGIADSSHIAALRPQVKKEAGTIV